MLARWKLSLLVALFAVSGAALLPADDDPAEEAAPGSGDSATANSDSSAGDDSPSRRAGAARKNPLPGRFPAPDLEGGTEWLNTAEELDLEDLRGKVVLLDFWTYCCINCMHILPDLKFLEEKYPNELVVIGVHSFKFENEKEAENIRQAILRYEISHPVVNDAQKTIARKYQANVWPTLVLIDPQGQYVGHLTGEGHRDMLDNLIRRMAAFHKSQGTLDDKEPLRFELERDKVESGPLKFPGKLLADEASDRLFIADSNHNRIVIATLEGQLIDVVGTGEIGTADGDYRTAQFDHPQGMVLDGRTLYVADTENHLLRKIDLEAETVSTLAGSGKQAPRAANARSNGLSLRAPLNSPWALEIREGVLYIAMAGPHQLFSHRLGSSRIRLFAGNGREHITDGPRLTAELAQPSGITHDDEHLYWLDSEGSALRKMPFAGRNIVTTITGPHDTPTALFDFGDIDGPSDRARLQHPLGLVYHDGMLYVADTYNHKIKRIDPGTGESHTWLGTGESGNALDPPQFAEPAGLSIAGGVLFIADTNNHRILTADPQTDQVSELTIEGLTPPTPQATP